MHMIFGFIIELLINFSANGRGKKGWGGGGGEVGLGLLVNYRKETREIKKDRDKIFRLGL